MQDGENVNIVIFDLVPVDLQILLIIDMQDGENVVDLQILLIW